MKTNRMKRFLAVVLTAMMVVALMPAAGGASFNASADSITARFSI